MRNPERCSLCQLEAIYGVPLSKRNIWLGVIPWLRYRRPVQYHIDKVWAKHHRAIEYLASR